MTRAARTLRVALAAAAITMAVSGCDSGGDKHLSLKEMRAHLDRIPPPHGAALKDTDEQPRQASAAGSITRKYAYTGPDHLSCRSLLQTITSAGYKLTDIGGAAVNPATCSTEPANPTVTTTAGAVFLTEPHSSTRIELDYSQTQLQLSIQDTAT